MKIINYIILGLAMVAGLSSCKENKVDEGPMGAFSLNIEAKTPEVSRALSSANTGDFPVSIQGVKGSSVEKVYRSFPSVNDLPKEPIMLPIGDYVVSSHTPGDLEKQMTFPYFAGEKEAKITKDVTTSTTVVCKMKNSRIQLKYNAQFLTTFQTWDITIDDGTGSVISFNHTEQSPAPVYSYFGEQGVPTLTVSIKAKTKSGNTISDSRILTKDAAGESYQGDTPNFVGGDGIDLNMDIAENAVGNVGIKINVNIAFTDHQDDVDVNIGDKVPVNPGPDVPVDPEIGGGDTGGDGTGGDTGGGEGGKLALRLPADFTYKKGDVLSSEATDAVFNTPNGLASAIVKIETDNEVFNGILTELPFDEIGALLKGAELIGNKGMQSLLDGMGKKTPEVGATEYTFPLGAFLNLLGGMPGKHRFYLTIVDQKGASASNSLLIEVLSGE